MTGLASVFKTLNEICEDESKAREYKDLALEAFAQVRLLALLVQKYKSCKYKSTNTARAKYKDLALEAFAQVRLRALLLQKIQIICAGQFTCFTSTTIQMLRVHGVRVRGLRALEAFAQGVQKQAFVAQRGIVAQRVQKYTYWRLLRSE